MSDPRILLACVAVWAAGIALFVFAWSRRDGHARKRLRAATQEYREGTLTDAQREKLEDERDRDMFVALGKAIEGRSPHDAISAMITALVRLAQAEARKGRGNRVFLIAVVDAAWDLQEEEYRKRNGLTPGQETIQ